MRNGIYEITFSLESAGERPKEMAMKHMNYTQSWFRFTFFLVCPSVARLSVGEWMWMWLCRLCCCTIIFHSIIFLLPTVFVYTSSLWRQCIRKKISIIELLTSNMRLVFHVAVNTFSFSATFLIVSSISLAFPFLFYIFLAQFLLPFFVWSPLCGPLYFHRFFSTLFFFREIRNIIFNSFHLHFHLVYGGTVCSYSWICCCTRMCALICYVLCNRTTRTRNILYP